MSTSESGNNPNNVVSITKLPPKTFKVRHRGLHGTVTYDPEKKRWHWVVKFHIPMVQEGYEDSQEKAVLTLKQIIETGATNKNVTTSD